MLKIIEGSERVGRKGSREREERRTERELEKAKIEKKIRLKELEIKEKEVSLGSNSLAEMSKQNLKHNYQNSLRLKTLRCI